MKRTRLLPRVTYVRDAYLVVLAVEGEEGGAEHWYFTGLQTCGHVHPSRVKVEVLPATEGHSAPEHTLGRAIDFVSASNLIEGDQVWLVLDVDRHHHLDKTIAQTRERGWQVAVSNPCFEVWLQLHFRAEAQGVDSKACKSAFAALRKDQSAPWPFSQADIDAAVERARQLGQDHGGVPCPPPATGVYRLVESLPRA